VKDVKGVLNEFKRLAGTRPWTARSKGVMNPRALVVAAVVLALLQCREHPREDRRLAQPKLEPPRAAPPKAKPPVIDEPKPEPKPATSPGKAKPVYRVGGEVSRPELIHRVDPDYARLNQRTIRPLGVAILEAVISENGTVESARMLRPADPDLDSLLLAAIRQWRFRPAKKDGKPVRVYYVLTVNIDWQ